MDRATFEKTICAIIAKHPDGFDRDGWRVKYDEIDEEYLCRWDNGHVSHRRKQIQAWYKDNVFIYY